MNEPVLLVKGSDQVLLGEAASKVLAAMVGGADPDEVVDTFAGDEYEVADAVMAASAVSMFGERVIVVRNASRFPADAWAPMIAYTADPNPTSRVLIVWDKPVTPSAHAHAVPKKLSDAIKACGGRVVDSDVGSTAKARGAWLDEQISAAAVRLSPAAKQVLVARLGEDVSRLGGVLRVLEASFPAGATLSPADIEPYMGEAGSVPPWELTDAIDSGDVPGAVDKLRRMMRAGERHPLQLMASLQNHFGRMLRLDGAGVRSEKEAADLLGMKGSTFPAKKALNQTNRLGSERIAQAVRLLANADVDLRGRTAVPPEATMEVLVARLARLSGSRR